MDIIKILYTCWVTLCITGWIISPMIGHNPDRVKEFFIMLGFIAFPLMIANLFAFVTTWTKKYLKNFLILLCCYPLAFFLFAIIVRTSFKGGA